MSADSTVALIALTWGLLDSLLVVFMCALVTRRRRRASGPASLPPGRLVLSVAGGKCRVFV